MGTGFHGGFGRTTGALVAGGKVFQSGRLEYFDYMARRTDVDKNGQFDVVAHGDPVSIIITNRGTPLTIDARMTAKLIMANPDYRKGQPVRLLSCDTGAYPNGFAQHLANKLNAVVEAPTRAVWADPTGHYLVAAKQANNNEKPDLSKRGIFKKFYPGGNRK